MKTKVVFHLFYGILIILCFRSLFANSTLSGGDYVIFWPENISFLRSFSFFAWDSTINLGMNTVGMLHYAPYNFLISWVGFFVGDKTFLWERLVWWIPFFVLSFFSTSVLFKKIFPNNSFWVFAPIIFVFNTYILLILSGGQIAGIGLAYALAPLVLSSFIKLINLCDVFGTKQSLQKKVLKHVIIAGLLLAAQIVFDLRISYVTLLSIGLYFLFYTFFISKKNFTQLSFSVFYALIVPFGVVGLLHSFWLLPTVLFRVNTIDQLGTAFSSIDAVKFFSFAKLENTISLLHPNWPENLFGKISFMRAEFIIVPLLAFSSLLFLDHKKTDRKLHYNILFFSLLALVGAFLAKGANEPFGQIYLWLFDHLPGFIMFRDPTKFYVLIALSYALLIPFSISQIAHFMSSRLQFKHQKNISFFFLFSVLIFWAFLIHPIVLGEVGGTFKSVVLPEEYKELKNFLVNDSYFSRTLVIPHRQRFIFSSSNHPPVDADSFFNVSSSSGVITSLKKKDSEKQLQDAGIKYITLPHDTEKEIFVKDNNYNENTYQDIKRELNKITWLKNERKFGEIIIYEVSQPKGHFWLVGQVGHVSYTKINPTQFSVSLRNVKKGERLVFSEGFDQHWIAIQAGQNKDIVISNEIYGQKFNSFVLPMDGDYILTVSFLPQKMVVVGTIISLIVLIQLLIILFLLRKI